MEPLSKWAQLWQRAVAHLLDEECVDTLKGKIRASNLDLSHSSEKIPCGQAHETMYFHEGDLVRQDVLIVVERGLVIPPNTSKG